MRVVLVGPDDERARLRAMLEGRAVEIVAEAMTLGEARAAGDHADAVILATAPNGESPLEALTPRESEVLELLAEGLSNKAIAARLAISDRTVKHHVASICGKLGAENRTDAVRRGVRMGLVAL